MLGYKKDELVGVDFRDITHPEDIKADDNLVHDMLSGRINNYSMNKRYIKKMEKKLGLK